MKIFNRVVSVAGFFIVLGAAITVFLLFVSSDFWIALSIATVVLLGGWFLWSSREDEIEALLLSNNDTEHVRFWDNILQIISRLFFFWV